MARRRTRSCALTAALVSSTLAAGVVATTPANAGQVPSRAVRSLDRAAPAVVPRPLFPPSGPWWHRDGTGLVGVYRLTTPRMGRRIGTPENYAIRVWPELLTEQGIRVPVTGLYGHLTTAAVRRFQARHRLPVTGRVNYPTARALLAPTIRREARRVGMSADLLCGHLDLESGLNPGAVNPNGRDLGIGQINIGRWNPGVSVREAFDEDFAIRYMARRDIGAYRRYGDWHIAVYDYNYPADAYRWARSGRPSERGRSYSTRVFRGCSGPEFPGNP